jgi:HlyD family secretion protein
MTANATIVVEELADVLMIPTWVVRVDRNAGQMYVHRQMGDGVERVDVQLGVRYEGFAQVLEGLSEGDQVVRLPESNGFDFGARRGQGGANDTGD